ncbi:MAG: GIY-YIG nuclease family protein [Patescibacteria group bacterium]|jgi:putative endonuclease
MPYFTYILKSQKNKDIYIGSCENVSTRLIRHNSRKVKSTKGYVPWDLLEYREFNTRSEAVKYERFLKTHQQKDIIKKKYNK